MAARVPADDGAKRADSTAWGARWPSLAILCGFALPLLGLATLPARPSGHWGLVRALGAGAPIQQIAVADWLAQGSLHVVVSGWGLYSSQDGGCSWKQAGAMPRTSMGRVECGTLAVSAAPQLLLLTQEVGQSSLLKSLDGGDSWVSRRGLQGLAIDAIVFSGGAQAYAMAGGSLYRSDDGGDTWLVSGHSPTQGKILAIAAGLDPPWLCLAASDGLWNTVDGRTWTLAWSGPGMRSLAGSGKQLLYAGGPAGLCRSEDGGKTWHALSLPREEQGVEALAVKDGTLSVALSDGSIWLGQEGGRRWRDLPPLPGELAVTALGLWMGPSPALLAGSSAGLWRLPLSAGEG